MRRGRSVFLVVGSLFASGAIIAHRNNVMKPREIPAAMVRRAPVKHWKERLDLTRTTEESGRLVQVFEDGTKVTFTVDAWLQHRAEALLRRYQVPYGAVVFYDLNSHRTLVLAGYSQRDASLSPEQLCLTRWAPAASVFKLVTASALLEVGVGSTLRTCYHGGVHGLDASHLRDNRRIDRRCDTLRDAVARSLNPVIAKLTLRYLTRDQLERWSGRYGFAQKIPFDLSVEPSRVDVPPDRLEFARMAAGFWHTEISALHGAIIASVPASGGRLVWPRLIEAVSVDGRKQPLEPVKQPQRIMREKIANKLARMMVRTTTRGSARKAFFTNRGQPYLPLSVAGKTGSLARNNPRINYSWFVGFAPADEPKIAFSVLLGNPDSWRVKASTAARLLISDYLNRPRPQQRAARRKSELHNSSAGHLK